MKHYSALLILAVVAALQVFSSCTSFTLGYPYESGYAAAWRQVEADTSRWWLEPVYIRSDTAGGRDSIQVRNFVWFHDQEQRVTYVKVSGDNSILFEPRNAEISSESLYELLYITALLENKPFSEMIIYGSTDNSESRDYSQELSEERAETVAEFFERMGYDADIIQAIGLGDSDPNADNGTIEGRAKNRYVDVFITIAD